MAQPIEITPLVAFDLMVDDLLRLRAVADLICETDDKFECVRPGDLYMLVAPIQQQLADNLVILGQLAGVKSNPFATA